MSTKWERPCARAKMQQFLCVTLLLAACMASYVNCLSQPNSDAIAQVSSSLESGIPVQAKMGPLETMAFWEFPTVRPKKVFLFFHGRFSKPYDFWRYSPSCPVCTGRPEGTKIVRDAIALDYAVFVPDSLVRNGDWDAWPENTEDLDNVVSIFFEWRREHGLEDLPVVGMGISAGGHVLSTLSLRLSSLFESIVIMVSKGILPVWDKITNEFPPTLFIHMPKDVETATFISEIRMKLQAQGVHSEEVRWYEQPISAEWFTELIRGLSLDLGRAIVQALIADGIILEENTFLTSMDFHNGWDDRVSSWGVLPDDPNKNGELLFKQGILDELVVAYALHATLSRRDDLMFAWFEGDYARATQRSIATY